MLFVCFDNSTDKQKQNDCLGLKKSINIHKENDQSEKHRLNGWFVSFENSVDSHTKL